MDYTLGDVLREINELRFYEGSLPPLERLPKGLCKRTSRCVIARCFRNSITDGTTLYWTQEIELPPIIREFITDFDNGHWPSLIEYRPPLIETNVSSSDSSIDVDSSTLASVGA
jgi:hypothetical protein